MSPKCLTNDRIKQPLLRTLGIASTAMFFWFGRNIGMGDGVTVKCIPGVKAVSDSKLRLRNVGIWWAVVVLRATA